MGKRILTTSQSQLSRPRVEAARAGLALCALGVLVACASGDTNAGRPSTNVSGTSTGFPSAGAATGPANGAGASGPPTATSNGKTDQPSAAGTGSTSSTSPGASTTMLDRGITFEWPETRPGQGGECQPGHYVGVFECEYNRPGDPDAGDPGVSDVYVTGPVEFDLERSPNGEFLEIANGHLDGAAYLIFGFAANLAGRLDCTTNMIQAQAVDGMWSVGDPNALPLGTFEGVLAGTYDPMTVTLAGDWHMTVADPLNGTCDGPWNVSYTP